MKPEVTCCRVCCAPDTGANGSAVTAAASESDQRSSDITKALPGFDKVAVLGNALWLMQRSNPHKHLFLTDIDWMLVPPVALEQYRLWRKDNLPVGFATWAFLSADAEARIRSGIRNLTEDDWNSGDQPWLMDLIVPFGGGDEAATELKQKIFKGRTVKTLRAAPDGGIAVVEW